jgi:glycosyltransferase involved in cell wall biosynthesis
MTGFADVSWVIAPSEREDEETARRTMREFDVRAVMRPKQASPGSVIGRPFRRLRHEFDRSFMETDDYVAEESDCAKLQELISEYDVVWIHTIRTAHWFRIVRWPHSVLDIDDLPSAVYRSTAQGNGSWIRHLKDRRMTWIWERRESFLLRRFDVLTVCTEADRLSVDRGNRAYVIPNGANPQTLHARKSSERPIIGFIGNCGFWPNENGLKWFIREVWPLIKREVPATQLRIVGAESDRLSTQGPDIAGLGWLADPGEEIASWSGMIVPIKMGSGTRVKIADGFARKCPVVSTPFGAFGYDVVSGRELILANTPQEFAAACLHLIRNPALGEELAEQAYARFLECWTWDSFQGTVERAVQDCLSRSASVGSSTSKDGTLQTLP